jgi:hypothetical protein
MQMIGWHVMVSEVDQVERLYPGLETSSARNKDSEEVGNRSEICCEKKAKEIVKCKQATELLASSGK